MPIRPMRLPQDLQTMLNILPGAFQYPDNPTWSINTGELENTTDTIQTVQRFWPILRIVQILSPSFRDVIDGVIWEEDNQPVGTTNVMRLGVGNSDSWMIANVGVLPDYRRRGIARKLVEAAIQMAKQRKAKRIILDVVDGNEPACLLYQSLGFEQFDTGFELTYSRSTPPAECPCPSTYALKLMALIDWQPHYQLERRITPPGVQRYFPAEEATYRVNLIQRVLEPILSAGTRRKRIGVYAPNGEIVAVAGYSARTRRGGINNLSIMLDPAHSSLATFLVHSLLNEIMQIAPGRTTEIQIRSWLAPVIDAAKAAGFEQRLVGNRMGLTVNSA